MLSACLPPAFPGPLKGQPLAVPFAFGEAGHAGRLELPLGREARGCAILLHTFSCSRSVTSASIVARALADADVATLRLDVTGLGNSGQDLANPGWVARAWDVCQAMAAMRATFPTLPLVLLGQGIGGVLALSALAEGAGPPEALVLIGTPATADPLLALLDHPPDPDRPLEGALPAHLGGQGMLLAAEVLASLASGALLDHLSNVLFPLLVVHGVQDEVVPVSHGEVLYTAAGSPRGLVSVPGLGHHLGTQAEAKRLSRLLVPWVEGLLLPGPRAQAASPKVPKGSADPLGHACDATSRGAAATKPAPEIDRRPGPVWMGVTADGVWTGTPVDPCQALAAHTGRVILAEARHLIGRLGLAQPDMACSLSVEDGSAASVGALHLPLLAEAPSGAVVEGAPLDRDRFLAALHTAAAAHLPPGMLRALTAGHDPGVAPR